MERNKDDLSKEKTSNKILNEEKDINNKEFERLLEKYDRYISFPFSRISLKRSWNM